MEEIFFTHEYYMKLALKEAESAMDNDEVPVGALIVLDNHIIAKAHNQTEKLQDCTAHAEMLAITAASNNLNSKYLNDCTIYVTLEPCVMCAGAIAHARVANLIYGANDPKGGFTRFDPKPVHPSTTVISGIEAHDCGRILTEFFHKKR